MNEAHNGDQVLPRAKRLFFGAFAVVLFSLAAVVVATTLFVRHGIRQQIAKRDGEVLHAMASLYYAEDVELGLFEDLTDPAGQLSVVVRASQVRGVLGVRLFDPNGKFLTSFGPDVTESTLDPKHLPRLKALHPSSAYHPSMPSARLFYTRIPGSRPRGLKILEVNVPLHVSERQLDGIAQFLLQGQGIAKEYAVLDQQLALEAAAVFLASAVVLGLPLGWLFTRLRRAHELVSKRTSDLVEANRELAFSARTSALGAVAAHLIHGLKNPVAGLEGFIAAQAGLGHGFSETDWRDAVASTQRIQGMIRQVVDVIREEHSSEAYEITIPELLDLLQARVAPVAAEREVTFTPRIETDACLENREANLVLLILLNLVENAIQASSRGALVSMTVSSTPTGLAFRVQDQGSGFPTQVPLFMPCRSTKAGGSGIGLALCKQLAQHLGAELSLTQNSANGCEFTLLVPAKAPLLESPSRKPPSRVLHALLLSLTTIGFSSAEAVDFPLRWRWSNPLPHGGNVVDMAFAPTIPLSVQVAERGQIYTSSDLEVWISRKSGTTNALRAAGLFGDRVLITGEAGVVLYADDLDAFQPGTLLDGPTSSWLEAVAVSPTLAVAAGDAGYVCTTTNGVHWKNQNSGTTAWLRGAAYGNGVFVLVGDAGTILRSTDGSTWSKRNSGTSVDLNRVEFANGRFTAVGESGLALSSANGGMAWLAEHPGATLALHTAASSGATRLLSGEHEMRLWENDRWSNELARTNGPPAWTYYTAIGQTDYYLVAGQTGLQTEAYRGTNGAWNWGLPYDSVRNWLWDIVHLPAFYVSVGDFGTIMTSGNGVDWTLELVPDQAAFTTLLGVGGDTNLLVAVGDTGTVLYSPNILTNIVITNSSGITTQTVSTLGVIWRSTPSFTSHDLQAAGVLSNSLYVVAGAKGSIFTSANGLDWVPQTSPTTNFLSSIAEWPGGLIAAGDNGTLLSSKDGKTWSLIKPVTPNWLYKIRWLNQMLVAVGQQGTILTSANGTNWFVRSSGTQSWLSDAVFIQDTWFVAGHSGTVLSSTDLTNWASRGAITSKSFYGAATDSQQLICVGVEGIILRSPVVPYPTPVSVLNFSRASTNENNTVYNLFLFGGKPDQQFTLDRSTNLVDSAWTTGPLLEITDGSGTLYYIETVTGTNQPPTEYYRASLVQP